MPQLVRPGRLINVGSVRDYTAPEPPAGGYWSADSTTVTADSTVYTADANNITPGEFWSADSTVITADSTVYTADAA